LEHVRPSGCSCFWNVNKKLIKTKCKMEKEKVRKGGQTQGVRTQKMMSFRVDNENWEWLETKANKGRYINELIRRDKEAQS